MADELGLDTPDPEPWQFCNQLRQMKMDQFREVLESMRKHNIRLYLALVATVRGHEHQNHS